MWLVMASFGWEFCVPLISGYPRTHRLYIVLKYTPVTMQQPPTRAEPQTSPQQPPWLSLKSLCPSSFLGVSVPLHGQIDILPKSQLDILRASYLKPVLFIGVVFISSMTGIMMSMPSVGFHIFMVLSIILSLITPAFAILSIMCFLYYIVGLYKKVVSK